jgi:Zn-finger nucleic acid-binding protein
MKKTTIGEHPEILIDACTRKDGLWFDGGEVAELIKELAKKKPVKEDVEQKVLSFLGDAFKARE